VTFWRRGDAFGRQDETLTTQYMKKGSPALGRGTCLNSTIGTINQDPTARNAAKLGCIVEELSHFSGERESQRRRRRSPLPRAILQPPAPLAPAPAPKRTCPADDDVLLIPRFNDYLFKDLTVMTPKSFSPAISSDSADESTSVKVAAGIIRRNILFPNIWPDSGTTRTTPHESSSSAPRRKRHELQHHEQLDKALDQTSSASSRSRPARWQDVRHRTYE